MQPDSRQNPFGLTVALDALGEAFGEIFWDSGDGEHNMGESYMCKLQYVGVSTGYSWFPKYYYCGMKPKYVTINVFLLFFCGRRKCFIYPLRIVVLCFWAPLAPY